jgi:hypothetical protein
MSAHRLPRRNCCLFFLILTLLLLSGCGNGPSEQIANDFVVQEQGEPVVQEQQADQGVLEELPSVLCSAEELEPPDLKSPYPGEKIWSNEMYSTLPAEFFQWSSISCIPEKYKVYFTNDPTWGTARLGQTDGQTAWPDPAAAFPQVPLEPATEYYWKVRAWADGAEGPDSSLRVFFTGPECEYNSYLLAPTLIAPLNGQTITSTAVTLRYKPQKKCLPRFYHVLVNTSPDWDGIDLGVYATPHQSMILTDLQDCTTFYWAVRSKHSPYTSTYPWSDVFSFTTDFEGTCHLSFALAVTALQDLACYQGPNAGLYPILGYLLQGETAEVVAQSLDMNWWYIKNPDGPENCAVPKDRVEREGDTEDIPLWNNPDLAPESEGGSGGDGSACSSYTTAESCRLAGCSWYTGGRQDICVDPP